MMAIQKILQVAYSQQYSQERRIDLYIPGANANGTGLLFIHGGGFTKGSPTMWAEVAQQFCELGYFTASTGYRLAPNWQYPAAIEDVRSAFTFLVSQAQSYNFDQNSLAVIGSSAGGYLALMLGILGTNPTESAQLLFPRALVLQAPVSTLQGMDNLEWVRDYLGAKEEAVPDLYKQASPINQINHKLAPTLIIHGIADKLIPLAHSERLTTRLRAFGSEVNLLELPEVEHGFGYGVTTEAQKLANAATTAFLTKHLFR
jgi:acetyl esterase/lipase